MQPLQDQHLVPNESGVLLVLQTAQPTARHEILAMWHAALT